MNDGWCPECHTTHDGSCNDYREILQLQDTVASLTEELERERMRLAACGVVAMANTPASAAEMRAVQAEYRSASLDDVARAVDRQIEYRLALVEALGQIRNAQVALGCGDLGSTESALIKADRIICVTVFGDSDDEW